MSVAALGGETVREKIWDVISAAFYDPASLLVMVAVLVTYIVLWYVTRPKQKPEPASDQFTQTHFGSGDNNMTF